MKNITLIIGSLVFAIIMTLFLILSVLPDDNKDVEKTQHITQNTQQHVQNDKNAQNTTNKIRVGKSHKAFGKEILSEKNIALPVPMDKLKVTKLSFIAVGDNLVHSSIYTDAMDLAQGTEKEYDFLPMYENVAEIIKDADIAFINQETPFGGDLKPIAGYPMFNTPDQVGHDLVTLGFDIIGLANNHMLDSTSKGYLRTIEFWEKKDGVLGVGGYKNKEDYENIKIYEKDGVKIAFLGYTYGTNGLKLPSNSELVIPLYNDEDIDRQTKKARELADIVIVTIHWGNEDEFKANSVQRKKAQIMIDNGVDVILGHHPHVLQEMKWVQRPDGGKTLVMYSLGNFLSGMMYSRNMVGGIMGFDIIKAPNGASVENASFIPTMCHYNSKIRGFKIYKFSEYTEKLENVHGAHKYDSVMSMEYMRGIINKAIPKEFLIEDFYK